MSSNSVTTGFFMGGDPVVIGFFMVVLIPVAIAIAVFVAQKIKGWKKKKQSLQRSAEQNSNCDVFTSAQFREYNSTRNSIKGNLQYFDYTTHTCKSIKDNSPYAEYIRNHSQKIAPESLPECKRAELTSEIQAPLERRKKETRPFAVGLAIIGVLVLLGLPILLLILSDDIADIDLAVSTFLFLAAICGAVLFGEKSESKKIKKTTADNLATLESNMFEAYIATITRKIIVKQGVNGKTYFIECGALGAVVPEQVFNKLSNQLAFVLICNRESGKGEQGNYFNIYVV